MAIRTMYTQQSTMFIWVTGVRVAGLGPKSTSPITAKSFSHIVRGKVASLFRHRSMSVIINYYKPPQATIIMTSIYPPIVMSKNYIILILFMNIFIYMTRKTGEVKNLPPSPGLWEEEWMI